MVFPFPFAVVPFPLPFRFVSSFCRFMFVFSCIAVFPFFCYGFPALLSLVADSILLSRRCNPPALLASVRVCVFPLCAVFFLAFLLFIYFIFLLFLPSLFPLSIWTSYVSYQVVSFLLWVLYVSAVSVYVATRLAYGMNLIRIY